MMPMSIRCKAEDKGWGMQLSEIPSLADARQLRQFLIENGLQPIIASKARSLPPVWMPATRSILIGVWSVPKDNANNAGNATPNSSVALPPASVRLLRTQSIPGGKKLLTSRPFLVFRLSRAGKHLQNWPDASSSRRN
jgi:hypothetical protein